MDFISGFRKEIGPLLEKNMVSESKLANTWRVFDQKTRKDLKSSINETNQKLLLKVDSYIVEHRFAAAKYIADPDKTKIQIRPSLVKQLRKRLLNEAGVEEPKDVSSEDLTNLLKKSTPIEALKQLFREEDQEGIASALYDELVRRGDEEWVILGKTEFIDVSDRKDGFLKYKWLEIMV